MCKGAEITCQEGSLEGASRVYHSKKAPCPQGFNLNPDGVRNQSGVVAVALPQHSKLLWTAAGSPAALAPELHWRVRTAT
jgi:hypothetical protein